MSEDIKVHMLRGARVEGKSLKPRKEYTVARSIARGLVASNKAKYVEQKDESDGPLTTENAGALTGES